MTEDEAKEKWCPFSRIRDDYGGTSTYNRTPDSVYGNCIASKCMMWQSQDHNKATGKSYGYCGLAR